MPVRRKTGKLGLITKPKVSQAMDRLAMQIPGWVRDLNLEHPDVEVRFFVCRDSIDRDNIFSSLLDLLWKYNVIKDDQIKNFNGLITLHPAIIGDEWKTEIQLRTPE
jgi:hypothetical protein